MAVRTRNTRLTIFTLAAAGSTWGLSGFGDAAWAQTAQTLDEITVVATKTQERAVDALAPVSVVSSEALNVWTPKRLSELFYNVPGVSFQDRGDDPSSSINIRGLQDFGRVAVVVDGARQNYQRTGHNANGAFFLDTALLAGVDVVRGPSANIYGSGAIGGVASFRTKDVNDVVKPGQTWGVETSASLGTNSARTQGAAFAGVRVNPNVEIFGGGSLRQQGDYADGTGATISNTANHVNSGLLKLTVRPADGHEVKLGGIAQEDVYNIGQFNRGATTTAAPAAAIAGTSVYATDVHNYQANARWRYSKPDDRIFDWDLSAYWNRTDNDQVKTYNNRITSGGGICTLANPGNNISGCVGDKRSYRIDTAGFDAHNTSRFDFGGWRNAWTYGGDFFQDQVTTADSRGNSNITTPSGKRSVGGAFLQWKANYSTWLEMVSAVRYDHYELSSATTTSSGSRLSPKITVGVTPVDGITPYLSYAEGYRAPSITETLIAGGHATGGGPALFGCPDGTSGLFCFLPNPSLRPEVGKNKEAGLNLRHNGIFRADDSFRGKINVFQNDVDDFIDLTPSTPVMTIFGGPYSQYYQYQNIAHARIQGFEAETMYDAGLWFLGVSGQIQRGINTQTGVGLSTIQPNRVTTTAGVRLFDRKLTLSGLWTSAGANTNVPATFMPNTSYELVNLYVSYQATEDVLLNFSIDNLLNRYYLPYAIPRSSTDGTSQNDVLWTAPPPGIVYKASLKVRFGG